MGAILDRIREAGALAWLRFVQALNWIMLSFGAALLMVHQVYPSVITSAIGKLPPAAGIPLIFGFCLLVHFALRTAKKSI